MTNDKQNNLKNKLKKNIAGPKKPGKNDKNLFVWILIIVGLFSLFQWVFSSFEETAHQMTYKEFYQTVETNDQTGLMVSAVMVNDRISGTMDDGKTYSVNIPKENADLIALLRKNVPNFDIKPPQTFLSNLFYSLGPMLIFILFLWTK